MPPFLEPTIEFFDHAAVPPAPDPPTTAAPLTPDHKSEAQRAYREARIAIALLQQRWPAAFPEKPQQVQPLAAGLVPLIAAELDWSYPYTRAVLRTWKLRPAYCRAVLDHPVRFDLDGNPTDEPVSEDARAQAKARLAALANRHRRPGPRPNERGVTPAVDHDPQQQGGTAGRELPPSKLQPPPPQSPPPAPKLHPAQQPSPSPAPAPPASKPRRRLQPPPAWRPGDKVRWHGYSGTFLRETVDDQVEVLIGTRTHRLPKAELRPTGQR